jgi:uncharacterized protein (TIGR02246 family)
MLIAGKCHCGNVRLTLHWPDARREIPARACGCSFCVKHGGVWTSDPTASLEIHIHEPRAVTNYRFGTETATFRICAHCGVVPCVTSEIDGRLYAVVNVNALENVDASMLRRASANFDGEDTQSRLARRTRNWIADVRIGGAATSSSATNEDDEREIRNLVKTWMDATRAGDLDRVLELMTDDVVFLVAGRPPMIGKAAFAAASRAHRDQAVEFDGQSDPREISIHGDIAYVWARLTIVTTSADRRASQRDGYTLSVFRKEHGVWRLARDANMLVASQPPA